MLINQANKASLFSKYPTLDHPVGKRFIIWSTTDPNNCPEEKNQTISLPWSIWSYCKRRQCPEVWQSCLECSLCSVQDDPGGWSNASTVPFTVRSQHLLRVSQCLFRMTKLASPFHFISIPPMWQCSLHHWSKAVLCKAPSVAFISGFLLGYLKWLKRETITNCFSEKWTLICFYIIVNTYSSTGEGSVDTAAALLTVIGQALWHYFWTLRSSCRLSGRVVRSLWKPQPWSCACVSARSAPVGRWWRRP